MNIRDILQLPKIESSINIIREFLNETITNSDFQLAFIHMLDIYNELGLFDQTISEGEYLLKEMDVQKDSINYEVLLKKLIDAALALKQYDRVEDYIIKRKEALPIIRQYLAVVDEMNLKKSRGLPYDIEIQKLLNDVIPTKLRINVLEELLALKKKENDCYKQLDIIEEILELEKTSEFIKQKYDLLLEIKNYEQAKELALLEINNQELTVYSFITLIKVYIEEKNYHKAFILDAEYEDFFDAADDETKRLVYPVLISLYQEVDNKLSIDNYKKKLARIGKKEAKEDKKEEIVVPDANKKVAIEPIVTEKKKTYSEFVNQLKTINELLIYSHQINANLPFRDFLRTFFIRLSDYLPFKECAVYLKDKEINFFHYKVERLYDKRIIDELLNNTVIKHTLTYLEEVLEEVKYLKWQKNIVTQKDYNDEITYVMSIPIGDIGVFLIHFSDDKPVDYTVYYDLVVLISSILYAKVIDEDNAVKLKNENVFLNNIINKRFVPMRIQSEFFATYNTLAEELFNVTTHYPIDDFYNRISKEVYHDYKALIRRLLSKANESFTITYDFEDRKITEKMISLKLEDEIRIVSIFEDITSFKEKESHLIDSATRDYETNLLNINALNNDMNEYLNEKVSFILISLKKDLDKIYGNDKIRQFFIEFSHVTDEFFQTESGKTYRFDNNTLFVVLNTNDIRSVSKIAKDYLKHLEETKSKAIAYESFNAYLGILRYPVVTSDKSLEHIYRFLHIALNNAFINNEEKVSFFSYTDYEEDVFEIQVIEYINEAINSHNLELNFVQITDIVNKKIWQYESFLSVPNLKIDSKYLYTIAKKRNRLKELEKEHITYVARFVKRLVEETKLMIKITIPVSLETFIDPTFASFLIGTLKKYQVDLNFIRLKIDGKIKPSNSKTIYELRDFGIAIDTNDIEVALSYMVDGYHYELKELDIKHQKYLEGLLNILASANIALVIRNLNNRDHRDTLAKLNIKYATGSLYKTIKDSELIEKIKESYEGN